ncbi:MAG: peptidase S41 [Pedobacter sp.]|nr:peptidase S41 [Chitinophagaceae bacterium]
MQSCISAKISNYQFNQKTAAPQLQADVVLLKKILEANHPSLYWYTPKDSIDAAFSQAINSIQDSLTEVAFRNKVAYVVNKIRCGHTAVRFSKNYANDLEKHRYPSFPLAIKTWGDSMVVLGSLFPRDSIFKRGTIITSINHKTNKQLLDSMFQLLSTDGYSNNFKSQVFSVNFSNWYKLAFGVDSSYTIGYIDNLGNEQTAIVRNFLPIKDTTKRKKDSLTIKLLMPPSIIKKPSRHEVKQQQLLAKRSLLIDTANNTAFLRVATFSNGRLRSFFRRSLRTIKENTIKNVVVDLRENTGGKLNNSTLLTKYFINKPFKTGDTVASITKSIHYKKYIPQAYTFWFPMQNFIHKKADDRFHKRREERHFYQPKTTNHFEGNIYLLQGGYTFSAGTLFVGNLKSQKNVTVVGEETGGGYYGNSAVFLPTIILPNSKLRLVLPLARLVVDSSRIKDGHGIIPDVLIQPSSVAIKQGIDLKMITIKQMISKKMAVSSTSN